MNCQIDFRTLPANVPSLCIPRVFANIDEKRIHRIFDDLNMGDIHKIDIISKTTEKGEKFNRVFVHFKRWFNNSNADTARERLLNGKEIKIIYDDPWFWKVSAYREATKSKAPSTRGQPSHKKPSLQFDLDEDKKPSRTPYRDTDEFGRSRRPIPREDIRRPIPRRSPSNSPPRQRNEENVDNSFMKPTTIDYSCASVVPKKRVLPLKKQVLKIEEEVVVKTIVEEKEPREIL